MVHGCGMNNEKTKKKHFLCIAEKRRLNLLKPYKICIVKFYLLSLISDNTLFLNINKINKIFQISVNFR